MLNWALIRLAFVRGSLIAKGEERQNNPFGPGMEGILPPWDFGASLLHLPGRKPPGRQGMGWDIGKDIGWDRQWDRGSDWDGMAKVPP